MAGGEVRRVDPDDVIPFRQAGEGIAPIGVGDRRRDRPAVRNVVANGSSLPAAVAAASRNPLAMLGVTDRGRLAPGQRADIVELDDELAVRRVMRAGAWV